MEVFMLLQLGVVLVSAPILVLIALTFLLRRPVASLRVTVAAILLTSSFAVVSVRDWYLIQGPDYDFSYVGLSARLLKFLAASSMLYVLLTEGGTIPVRTATQGERDIQQQDTQDRQNRRDLEQDAREVRQR